MSAPAQRRIVVLYNADYDDAPSAAPDESAVHVSAQAVERALTSCGLASELRRIQGSDLGAHLGALQDRPPALVFNLCESLGGDTQNELLIPAVLDLLKLPYTGSDALTLGMCLHKQRAKEVLIAHGIATPAYRLLESPAAIERRGADARGLEALPYPCFLKLARQDASVGINRTNLVSSAQELIARASELFAMYRQPLLCEQYIDGREVNVSLLGNPPEVAILPLHEIDYSAMPAGCPPIITYAGKWDESHEEYRGSSPVLMTDAPPALRRAIEDTAAAAYLALGVRDYGRIDLRIDAGGRPWVIDINPNCDLAPDAGFFRAAGAAGMGYTDLVSRICELAWRRHEARQEAWRAS